MRVLVLGGSVFVGRTLVEHLVAGGHSVSVLNRGRTPTALPVEVDHLVADRTDLDSMRAALVDTEWDAVYDVSGFVMVAGGSDIGGLLDLVDGRVGRYVYVSSIMAYDQSLLGVVPWVESMPTDAGGPATYGGFKAMAEAAMLDRQRRTGFPATVVRPAAIYGPHNNIYDMETPMFLRLLRHLPILVPHGGLVTGSYGHVDDLCRAMIDLVEVDASIGEVFNVTAEATTTRHYVEVLAEVVGVEPDVVVVPDDRVRDLPAGVWGHLFSDRHHAVLSTEKLARVVGSTPEHDLRSGHERTYAWFQEQGLAETEGSLADPIWRASWDFAAEEQAAAMLR